MCVKIFLIRLRHTRFPLASHEISFMFYRYAHHDPVFTPEAGSPLQDDLENHACVMEDGCRALKRRLER